MQPRLISTAAAAELFDSERSRQARYAHALTQRELADLVGVSRSAIAQYENGHSRPDEATLARLASAVGYPLGYFVAGREIPPSDDGTWHFRGLAATTKRERRRAAVLAGHVWELAQYLDRHIELPGVCIPKQPVSESAALSVVEGAAQLARRALGVPEGPVSDVVRFLEVNGAIVARLPFANEGVDAFSGRFSERPTIFLTAEKQDHARSRFDAAHELGHVVMHADGRTTTRDRERQADAFAAEFLMPRAEIVDLLPEKANFGRLLEMKHTWGTSIASLLYRARELGVMSDPTYRRAVTRMSSHGWRTNEPGTQRTAEEPIVIRQALRLLADMDVTLDQVAADVSLPKWFVESFSGDDSRRPALSVAAPS